MRAAIIRADRVENVIEVADLDTAQTLFPDMIVLEASPEMGIGFIDDGEGNWIAPPPPPADTTAVDAERDRRVAAGFTFGGKLYQGRPEDRENIAGAALAALAAIMNGAAEGNLRWHGGDSDFVWIAADNSLTPMDAQTMFAFGQAAMAHKQAHIFAARAIKDADPIPVDFTDNGYWP